MLTKQQQLVLQFAANGMKTREIGMALSISDRTVEAHLKDARQRLEAKTTVEAVAKAIRAGIVMALTAIIVTNTTNYMDDSDMNRRTRNSRRRRENEELTIEGLI